ncbi:MAG: ribonuclease HII [Chthoniobacterales bacterium]|nr:ribonuclease HII [Chthoniobacterales bacterium]
MPCSFEQEELLVRRGIPSVAGIDEAGRGPLAGPVVAAAVVLPPGFHLPGLDDSKKLSATKRDMLYVALTGSPGVRWASAHLDNNEVDRWNILRATHRAMRQAFLSLKPLPEHALIDGLPVPDFPCPQTALVGGDALSLSIAAASIIAKVERDRAMDALDAKYPEYGFSAHKGYPTPAHLAKLREHGPCPIHRRSFSPVAQAELF